MWIIKQSGAAYMFCNWGICGAVELIYQRFHHERFQGKALNSKSYIIVWRKRTDVVDITK